MKQCPTLNSSEKVGLSVILFVYFFKPLICSHKGTFWHFPALLSWSLSIWRIGQRGQSPVPTEITQQCHWDITAGMVGKKKQGIICGMVWIATMSGPVLFNEKQSSFDTILIIHCCLVHTCYSGRHAPWWKFALKEQDVSMRSHWILSSFQWKSIWSHCSQKKLETWTEQHDYEYISNIFYWFMCVIILTHFHLFGNITGTNDGLSIKHYVTHPNAMRINI